ncbi:MAG TPA: DUF5985 family protein [Bryobacteraceae bacterium]|nr:DUF5985 family protein [Bryobacteraceae bacterium]
MASAVNLLGALTCLLCSFLLFRAWSNVRKRLLFWSGLCFAGLTISNALVFADLVLFPDLDLYPWRLGTAAVAVLLLLYGLIFGSD